MSKVWFLSKLGFIRLSLSFFAKETFGIPLKLLLKVLYFYGILRKIPWNRGIWGRIGPWTDEVGSAAENRFTSVLTTISEGDLRWGSRGEIRLYIVLRTRRLSLFIISRELKSRKKSKKIKEKKEAKKKLKKNMIKKTIKKDDKKRIFKEKYPVF